MTGEGATQEAIALIGGVLSREVEAGRVTLDDPTFAAEQFLQMVLTIPQRRALGLGKPMTPAELEAWARAVVDLFLDGCGSGHVPRLRRVGKGNAIGEPRETVLGDPEPSAIAPHDRGGKTFERDIDARRKSGALRTLHGRAGDRRPP